MIYVKRYTDKDYRSQEKMILDGEEIYSVMDLTDCPEDATVGRDLTSCNAILRIIKTIGTTDFETKYIDCENEEEYDDDTYLG